MSTELAFTILGACVSIGVFVGVTRTQTKVLGDDIKKLGDRVDRCVTKSDFPAFFAREKHITDHTGAK